MVKSDARADAASSGGKLCDALGAASGRASSGAGQEVWWGVG